MVLKKFVFFFLLISVVSVFAIAKDSDTDKINSTFWNSVRTGANFFNKTPTREWFQYLAKIRVSWIRLAFDKWASERRDFLLGDADEYRGLIKKDLLQLIKVLDWAEEQNIMVVIVPLSLPGARWRQNNNNRFDGRLWQDKRYWSQAKEYWKDISIALLSHPAVVAYNIVNEPAPENKHNVAEHTVPGDVSQHKKWYAQHQGTAADLYEFYSEIIAVIRKYDVNTAIMVDAGWYAQPGSFAYWPGPLQDNNVLYSFHMYEPYNFTSGGNFRNKTGLVYPGIVPFGDAEILWNKDTINTYFAPFFTWARKHDIPSTRIVAGEFGCMRRNKGCDRYLEDVLDVFDTQSIHWAFYSFREDEWDGYDYEVGSGSLPWEYWKAKEQGKAPSVPRSNTVLFRTIKNHLK